ncbi:MAG: D-alanyl-D-alanine carboxypeptidase family protein [Syntrophomonadaceae bacterium]|nr:D-alanyl-D-alanine carboxypeptidase family protein [Syntrophomonadaceae bacterium]
MLLLLLSGRHAFAAAPELASTSAVLMDADTGQILYEKNLDRAMHPASITKIMTILLAVENSKPHQQVIVGEDAVMSLPVGTSNIGLQPGELVTMEELLYAAAMMSANEACNIMAEAIAGSNEAFVAAMNQRAQAIGCTNTHFANPHGLTAESHYSSARDMAMITREAMQNKEFRKYFGAVTWEMGPTNKADEPRYFTTQHEMLWGSSHYYEGADGGKTGYTSAALNTLVTSATRDDRRLIAVVMQSESATLRYADTAALLDYGFDEFKAMTIARAQLISEEQKLSDGREGSVWVNIHPERDFHYLLHESLAAPEVRQTIIAPEVWSEDATAKLKVTMAQNDASMYRQLGVMPLTISVISADTAADHMLQAAQSFLKTLLKILLIIIAVLMVLIVILRGRKLYKDRQRREWLRRQREAHMRHIRERSVNPK